MEQSPSEKLLFTQQNKKFSDFYGTRKFIIMLKRVHHRILYWASWI